MPPPQIAATSQRARETAGGEAPSPATLIVVGGIDPSGGAGILRDVATAAALGAHAYAVGTAWTEQGPDTHRIEPRDPSAVADALTRAIADQRPAAIKIGMAVAPATAEAILTGLTGYKGPIVMDPVLATTRAGPLWLGPASALLELLRRASLVTPNGPEAAMLANRPIATVSDAEAAARRLVAEERLSAVLVKGGHLPERDHVVDVLATATSARRFEHTRVAGGSPRGTGCALATAIAIGLGRGKPLILAIEEAITWLASAIAAARPTGGELHLRT